jgi:hypothetical protein
VKNESENRPSFTLLEFSFRLVAIFVAGPLYSANFVRSKSEISDLGIRLPDVLTHRMSQARRTSQARRRTFIVSFVLGFLLDQQVCAVMIGDLEERRQTILRKFGCRRANIWYWIQIIRSVPLIGWERLKDVCQRGFAEVSYGNR